MSIAIASGRDEVSTGSGSDRIARCVMITLTLPDPVATAPSTDLESPLELSCSSRVRMRAGYTTKRGRLTCW